MIFALIIITIYIDKFITLTYQASLIKFILNLKSYFFSMYSHFFSLRKTFAIIKPFLIIYNRFLNIQTSRIIILTLNVKTIKKRFYRLIA